MKNMMLRQSINGIKDKTVNTLSESTHGVFTHKAI
jgi:hypothetical protein